MKQPYGRFDVPLRRIAENPDEVRLIMGQCIVVACVVNETEGLIHYIALSPEFDPVETDSQAPYYSIISNDHGDVRYFRFQRKNQPTPDPSDEWNDDDCLPLDDAFSGKFRLIPRTFDESDD